MTAVSPLFLFPNYSFDYSFEIIPDSSHDFASGLAVDSIKLIVPLIIIPIFFVDYSQLFPIIPFMLIIEAGPMVIH